MPFFRKKKKEEVRMVMRGFPGDANTCKCLLMAAEKKIKLGKLVDELEPRKQKQMSFELPQFLNGENRIGSP